mmetsp:Transcript_5568/g.22897  ORF Transcript_5568/g.22897 Transcript_5568/m.22897 type:complete len:362 (+) Transcript_5568:3261-4346(+)
MTRVYIYYNDGMKRAGGEATRTLHPPRAGSRRESLGPVRQLRAALHRRVVVRAVPRDDRRVARVRLDLQYPRRLRRRHPRVLLSPQQHQRAVKLLEELTRGDPRPPSREGELVEGTDRARILRRERDGPHELVVHRVLVHLLQDGLDPNLGEVEDSRRDDSPDRFLRPLQRGVRARVRVRRVPDAVGSLGLTHRLLRHRGLLRSGLGALLEVTRGVDQAQPAALLRGGGCRVQRREGADGVARDDRLVARGRARDVAGEVDHLLPPKLHAVRLLNLGRPPVAEHAQRVHAESPPRERGDGVAPVVRVRAEAVDEDDDGAVVHLARGDVVAPVAAPLPERPSVRLEREPLHAVVVALERGHR